MEVDGTPFSAFTTCFLIRGHHAIPFHVSGIILDFHPSPGADCLFFGHIPPLECVFATHRHKNVNQRGSVRSRIGSGPERTTEADGEWWTCHVRG